MSVEVRPLTAADEGAFHSVQACDGGWCQCVAWWVPTWEAWGERTAEQNAELRRALFDRGIHDGFLAFRAGEPVGWCQVGPRDQWPKLVESHGLQPDPDVWAVTCFKVVPEHRGEGVAHQLLHAVLAHLAGQGVARVQAFPRSAAEVLPADEVWTGPQPLFERAGFARLQTGSKREVWEWRAPAP